MEKQRVHILTSWACTNNCIFCMDNKTDRKFITIKKAQEDLINWLNYSNEVTFTSWEPTIHPQIIELVNMAKKLWYKTIQIISNGRKFKEIWFVLELINAWVTDFIVSIHWYNSFLHDNIVQNNWAFKETLEWLINICKLKNQYKLVLNTNTTIFKQNYTEIYKIIHFLEKFSINSIVINVVIPQWEAIINNSKVLIKYSSIVRELEKIIPFQDRFHNIYINWLPFCSCGKLLKMIGFRESIQFEQSWEKYIRQSENHSLKLKWDLEHIIINWKNKIGRCKICKYYNTCEWLWNSYTKIYWWKEFNPII